MVKRGPKPQNVLDRLAYQIRVGPSRTGPDLPLAHWARRPVHTWPTYLASQPWIWIGAVSRARQGLRRTGQGGFTEFKPVPKFRYRNGWPSVPRLLHELMIGPLPERHILKYKHLQGSSLIDVNPLNYVPVPRGPQYPWGPEDFTVGPTMDVVGSQELDDEMHDLVSTLELEYARQPFTTWEEFNKRFEFLWFDVPEEKRIRALEISNLLSRLR